MSQLLLQISFNHLLYFTLFLSFLVLGLIIYNIKLSKTITKITQTVFSTRREQEQRYTILESIVSQLSINAPSSEKSYVREIQEILEGFSLNLNKKVNITLKNERDNWHEKFAILLSVLDVTEEELKHERDLVFKDSWASITELRQKSQLLFKDMKEDGIFYRTQSLWLLSNISMQEKNHEEAFDYLLAALKLSYESKPVLPVTHKLVWKIARKLVDCTHVLDKETQSVALKKFHINPKQIAHLYQEYNPTGQEQALFQNIQSWANQISYFI